MQKEFLAFFCDEQAAYDHETDVIDEIGLANLTNVLPGGQKAWERRQKERAERRPAPIVIDWHDIASRIAYVVRASDGLTKQISLRVSDSVEFAKYRNAIGEAIDKAYGSMTEFARLVIGQMRIKKGDKFVADEFAKYGIVFV